MTLDAVSSSKEHHLGLCGHYQIVSSSIFLHFKIFLLCTCVDPESAPRNCSAEPLSSEAIRVTWVVPEVPNGLMKYYNIFYRPLSSISGLDYSDNASLIATILTTDNSTTMELSNLLKGTSYDFSLTAFTVVGEGPHSNDTCIAFTLEDSKI